MHQSGARYFFQGFNLIKQPKLLPFVAIPFTINVIIFIAGFYHLFGYLEQTMTWFEQSVPEFLTWLTYILWPLAIILMLLTMGASFSIVANLIAAPFNGLLSEKVEEHLLGVKNNGSLLEVIKDLPRVLGREWQKLKYWVPRAILCLVLFWVPVIGQTAAPVIWLVFCCWMYAIQYCDFPFDNHKVSFTDMKSQLGENKSKSLSFGLAVNLLTMVPILNAIVMPVAVCGATAMWVDHYRKRNTLDKYMQR
ncbi:sulfate transporter CysZ [Paraferrimonas sp. SM1919]|uniref:sulfate transporter CysZ n=1 Tax=Paraferrimonas sp. SM1919 TaxID=2662263 RepID=UPI0013D363D2|nr:sulfate transporter CysZ [Paraferrimonas sp. SM1919]